MESEPKKYKARAAFLVFFAALAWAALAAIIYAANHRPPDVVYIGPYIFPAPQK
jgi:hypothetical protein